MSHLISNHNLDKYDKDKEEFKEVVDVEAPKQSLQKSIRINLNGKVEETKQMDSWFTPETRKY